MAPPANLIFSLFSLLFTGNYQRRAAIRRQKASVFCQRGKLKNSEKTAAGCTGAGMSVEIGIDQMPNYHTQLDFVNM
jgi:hypothetical protein